MKKFVSGIVLALLLIGMGVLTVNLQSVTASGTISIRADGSVDPLVEASTTVTPWPMFRHDSEHTGYSTSTVSPTANLVWSFTTHGFGRVTSSPTIADNKIFVGSDNYKVYALDQSTGVEIWNFTTGAEVHSSPAVADGRVFVGSSDGYLYALYETTGKLNWSRKLVDGIVYASPTVAYEKVFVTAFETIGSHYGYVYALNKTTGETIWTWRIQITAGPGDPNALNMYVYSSPAVVGGTVFFGAHEQWTRAWPYSSYYRSCIFAVSAIDGSKLWETRIVDAAGIYVLSSPSIVDGSSVFIGNDDGYLYALDYFSGALRWKNATKGAVRSSPALADGKVFVSSNDGNVYAFDMWTGNQVWNYTTGGPVRSSPAVADGKVVVASDDGYLYVLNENAGTLKWKYSLGNVAESSPAVADGLIFCGSNAGRVCAFGPASPTPTKIRFHLTPNPVNVGQTVTLLGNLTTDQNSPITGAEIKVKSNGTQVATLTTNSTGWFKASRPPMVVGTFNVTVEYQGSLYYMPSSAWEILTVKSEGKIKTQIFSIFIPNPVGPGQACELRGILVDRSSIPIKVATVSLEYSVDDGLTWNPAGTLTTDSYGIFSKVFTAPSTGTYLVRISYAGSPIYESSKADILLKVH